MLHRLLIAAFAAAAPCVAFAQPVPAPASSVVRLAVPSATTSQFYGGTGAAGVSRVMPNVSLSTGTLTLGASGVLGSIVMNGATSGTTTLVPFATGGGSWQFPAVGGTIVGTAQMANALPGNAVTQFYGATAAQGTAQVMPQASMSSGTLSLGTNASVGGAIVFNGTTSGAVTLQPTPGAAGTPTLNFPTLGGTLATAANISTALPNLAVTQFYGGTAGAGVAQAMPQAAMSSGQLQLGTVGATQGQIALRGATSGFAILTAPAAAGTPTFTLPTTTGTLATLPSATTGQFYGGTAAAGVGQIMPNASMSSGNLTLGTNGSIAGAIILNGATSGSASIAPSATGNPAFTLGQTSGTLATTANINTALPSVPATSLLGGTGAAGSAQAVTVGAGLSLASSTITATRYITPINAAAAGTTQGTATVVTFAPTFITSGTGGVILPQASTWAASAPFNELPIYNRSGASIKIYPFLADQIEANGANVAITITNGSAGRMSVDATGTVRVQ